MNDEQKSLSVSVPPGPEPPPSGVPVPAQSSAQAAAPVATLSPEQEAALTSWKESHSKELEAKYKGHREKAEALEQLVRYPGFQKWYMEQTKVSQAQGGLAGSQASGMSPQNYATPEEWSQAVIEASNGDPARLQEIQTRMFTQMATPVVREFNERQKHLQMTIEMRNLFDRHPDAKDLDAIGRNAQDSQDESPSLLEIALEHMVEGQGKSVEEGYLLARRWADAMNVQAKGAAMGMINDKKGSVTAPPSSSNANQQIEEVATTDELIEKNMEALLSGQKAPKFVVKR